MEHSFYWQANSCSTVQEILHFFGAKSFVITVMRACTGPEKSNAKVKVKR